MTTSLKNKPQAKAKTSSSPREADLLDALPLLVLSSDGHGGLTPINKTAQEFWGAKTLELPVALIPLVARVQNSGEAVTAHDVPILKDLQEYRTMVHALPMDEGVLLTMDLKGTPHAPAASAWKQEITRAAGVMAAMMAHEVKNPLSSIRGAAQLLRDTLPESERGLADLICNESLRIRDLLDQVEVFSDEREVELAPLNIHEVLQYSMRVAKAGFAEHIHFVEKYDPSLPEANSHRDMLIQLFLNIIKNASEALHEVKDATITLTTSYHGGFRMTNKKLPLTVTISDNGHGIPEDIRRKLFEPLVSSKAQGRGLGLAVVAKIAADIGAVVECNDPGNTTGASFTIYLPVAE